MLKPHKIKSLTLAEMIVAIGITSIVAGLAFAVLTLVRQQMKSMSGHYETTTQWQLLEQSLWTDLHRYRDISYEPEAQTLRLKHELDSVNYVFYTDKVVKARDTFRVSVTAKGFYYNGEAVPDGAVDALQLQAEAKEQQHKKLFIYKKNDASNTINSWHFN